MWWRYVMLASVAGAVTACGEAVSRVEVPFVAVFEGAPLGCSEAAGTHLSDLRFYVHSLALIDGQGNKQDVRLDEGFWQSEGLALLDLEDGEGSCTNGTRELNASVTGTVAGEEWAGLEFTLGVPFALNHGDPLKAQPPLGDADMHWHWRGGYKFLRAGIRNETDSFWIHLGSTGCEGTIRNISACSAPNRVTVRLDDYVPGDIVTVDLAEFVKAGVLDDALPTDCSSGPAEEHCADAFTTLGLNHATGATAGQQKIFSIRRAP